MEGGTVRDSTDRENVQTFLRHYREHSSLQQRGLPASDRANGDRKAVGLPQLCQSGNVSRAPEKQVSICLPKGTRARVRPATGLTHHACPRRKKPVCRL